MSDSRASRPNQVSCPRCRRPLGAESSDGLCETCHDELGATIAPRGDDLPDATAVWQPQELARRYERLELLGRGGMGEVYRARQTELDRIVALKLVLSERSQDPKFVARFRREACAMARLSHPHIIAIHDFGELDGRPFLAMEFVSGSSLRIRLRHGALPVDEALDIGTQLCEAIAYAHELGIVHRDLKPENVMMTDDGRVKVADFGLAKLVGPDPLVDLTSEGAILGTLRYMAPEQLAGARDVDQRADVYSLGVVLYEMLTGRLPVGRFAPPSRLAAVTQHLDDVLLKALDADRTRRFASGRELAAALALVRSGEPGVFTSPTWGGAEVPILGNLPQAATSLVGREDERQLLRALLSTGRLVTLTGPGGTGKSRLALQLGLDCGYDFADGIWFVPLAELTDPRRVPEVVAAALGLREETREIGESVRAHLADREALLILDNFEQIVAAAPFVAGLLAAAPRLRLVVTSRVALHVAGEHEFPVGPLALPGPSDALDSPSLIATSPAVALFVERGSAVRADFQLTPQNLTAVIEICRRLDGLPLAIELAAARVKLLDPPAILARMSNSLKLLTGGARDLPARQQTMRAAIAWSYDLLSPPQRTLLAWLAILRGSFTVESAERLVARLASHPDVPRPATGELLDESDVLDALTALVEQNLVRRAASDPAPRLAMYETIREFADEQLRQAGDLRGLRHAHAQWCLETVQRGEPALTDSDPSRVLAEWDAEMPDFRAALSWWRGEGDRPDDALRMIGELWYYWVLRARANEGIEETAATVQHPRATPDTPEFSRGLHALGTLCFLRDRPREARVALERALDIRRRLEPEENVLGTLANLAAVKRSVGDLVGARQDFTEVIVHQRRRGDQRALAIALSNLSLVDQFLGRLDDSVTSLSEALAIYAERNDHRGQARQLLNLGRVQHMRGRYVEALEAFQAAREHCEAIGDTSGVVNATLATANALTGLQRYAEARRAFDQCGASMGLDESPSRRATYHIARGYLEWKTGRAEPALADYRAAFRLRAEHQDFYGIGEVLVVLAEVYASQGRLAEAARLLGAESRIREQVRYAHSTETLAECARTWQIIREGLGVESARLAEEEGRHLTLEQVAEVVQW